MTTSDSQLQMKKKNHENYSVRILGKLAKFHLKTLSSLEVMTVFTGGPVALRLLRIKEKC